MIDADGYRANVGIILCNQNRQVMWARRIGHDAWQFPQGGVSEGESPSDAMYRELWEETGLKAEHVSLIAATDSWLRYKLPKRLIRKNSQPRCIGQKQMWYLLKLDADEDCFDLSASDDPEFDHWEWVDYWSPLESVIYFKRRVYECALAQLEDSLPGDKPKKETLAEDGLDQAKPQNKAAGKKRRSRGRRANAKEATKETVNEKAEVSGNV